MTFAHIVHALAWIGALGWPLTLGVFLWRSRRLKRVRAVQAFTAAVSVAWALCVWAFLIEPAGLVVRQVEIASPAWTGPPVRIGVIADLHVGGPQMSPARVRRIAARMNAEAPDLILLAGDYISNHLGPDERSARANTALEEGVAALGALEAPLGVVAVLGNHDWWYDGVRVEDWLVAAGLPVLENDAVQIARGEDSFWVAGVADYYSDRAQPSFDQALARVPETDDVIALGHWPDVFAEAPGRVALTVAGHSHCGQLNLPILGRPAVSAGAARWPCGLYEEGGRLLYVTGGIGTSVLPARFCAPPEIVVITLSGAPRPSD
ncbi:MAG: metallophosphoesterase [Maricaulaceae bacterium]|jgi:predicted MPP superfamily phosphohydrolase